MAEWKKTICPYDCPQACGLLVEVDGDKIINVKGDPDHPLFKGMICSKMQHYERALNSPKRLLTPMKRVGEKGEGKFAPISWEQAISEITDKWKEILQTEGPDAFLGLSSSGTQGIIQKNIVDALSHKIGARRMVMTLCDGAKNGALESTMGGCGGFCPSEIMDSSDYFLVWSCNLKATKLHTLSMIQEQRKAGKKAVLIEVCAVDNAQYCDETILIRPGSDGALALGMMHVLDREGMIDEAYMQEYTSGFDAFRKTLPQYTPEWAAEKTGLAAETIERLAKEFGMAKAPAVLGGAGFVRRGNGGMNARLLIILSAITGAWNKGGGLIFGNPKDSSGVDKSLIFRPDLRTNEGIKTNINLLSQALSAEAEVPVKAFYLSGGNPVNAVHDQQAMEAALMREDLFTVVHEQHMTDTTDYADYVLPATFSPEHADCYSAAAYSTFGVAYQAVKAPGEAKSNWDTICLLAQGMGYTDDHFKMTAEDMLEIVLANPTAPLSLVSEEEMAKLKKGGTIMVPYSDHSFCNTPDGKLRIVDETNAWPMPAYKEDFPAAYPLNMVAVPGVLSINTAFDIRDDLMEKRGPAKMMIHPEEAAKRGLTDGCQAIAYNDMAEVTMEVMVTELVAKGCVAVASVYNKKYSGQKLQINALHKARLSDLGEGTTMNGNFVEVKVL